MTPGPPPPAERAKLPRWKKYFLFLGDVFASSARDDLPFLSAALSYYALLSFVPLLLLTASVLGMVFKSEDNQRWATDLLIQYLPIAGEALTSIFDRLVRQRGTVGGFGLVTLLWISMRIFVTLQRALDKIWNIEPEAKRPFYIQIAIALPTIGFVGVFAYLSFFVTTVVTTVARMGQELLRSYSVPVPDLVTFLGRVVSAFLSIMLVFAVYRLLPSARVRSKSAIVGAALAGTLWEASKTLFTWYVNHFAQTDQIYGAMGGLVVVMLWTFLSSLILLFGAEVVACHARWIAAKPVVEEVADEPVPDRPQTVAPNGTLDRSASVEDA